MAHRHYKEDDILGKIAKLCAKQNGKDIVLGPGDDCALIKPPAGHLLVVTSDELAENTHFKNPLGNAENLAVKLVASNLSDLAGMGAVVPCAVLCNLAMPKNTPSKWVDRFLSALLAECGKYKVSLAGGNLARADRFHLSLTALGWAKKDGVITRKGAADGDYIFGIGNLGTARAGLEIALSGKKPPREFKKLVDAFWKPKPHIADGRVLAESGLVKAMLDNSDGLLRSVKILTSFKKLGAEIQIEDKAVSPALEKYAAKNGKNILNYLISGGEEYGLVFAVAGKNGDKFRKLFPKAYYLGRLNSTGKITVNGAKNLQIFEHF